MLGVQNPLKTPSPGPGIDTRARERGPRPKTKKMSRKVKHANVTLETLLCRNEKRPSIQLGFNRPRKLSKPSARDPGEARGRPVGPKILPKT